MPTSPERAHEDTPLLADQPSYDNASPPDDSEASSEIPLADEPSTAKLVVTMGSVWVGVFLAALVDSTIIATLSAPISASFKSFTLLSWLATAYLIANAALQPLSGRLTDIFSRRAGLLFSNVFFCVGNLICGLAKSEWVIIFGRVIAGIGGGGLTAISTFVGSDLVPLRRRGLWQGFGNICFGLGSGLGGVFGGWINDTWGWRNAFLIQVPLVAISGIIVFFTVKVPVKEKEMSRIRRVDFLGSFALVASLVLLLLGLNSGGNIVPWKHPLVFLSLPLALVFFAAFIYVEDKVASEPVIPVRLLLDRTVLAGCLTNWFGTMSVFAILYFGPIYFQVRGYSATQAGARIVPQSIGTSVGSLGAGVIMRATGKYYWLNAVIQSIYVVAAVLITATFNRNTSEWLPIILFFLGGTGYGGMLTITLLALISAVDHEHQAVITSASYAFRSTGSTIGITVASAVFQNILKSGLWEKFGDRDGAADMIGRLRDSIDEIRNVPPQWKDEVLDTYMDALRGVWVATLVMGAATMMFSLAMREHVLHTNLARR
ncbi:major facilitator superfamily domain-containing protein [Lineolata rhizophorae]|uniref:Major facilitator superfamily domain-containing protein n=1 Tax=Lineolata rhizophorae TaxID=578093 RepID=A0A6A6NQ88_9PEZI|nr:major facilitator superfamily domain-containing protein [Lineolata rhizophorae]